MAKSSRAKSKPAASPSQPYRSLDSDDWGGFINLNLGAHHKEEFDRWLFDVGNSYWSLLDDLIGKGVKVSVSYDEPNQCYVCSFTGRLMAVGDWRCVMTTRAGTLNESIALSIWKFAILGGCDLSDYAPRTGNLTRWG